MTQTPQNWIHMDVTTIDNPVTSRQVVLWGLLVLIIAWLAVWAEQGSF